MAGSSFGKLFQLHTFGESHGKAIGGIIDGCPAGINLDLAQIQSELDKRKPGQSKITTQRKESDVVEFLSGILENTTLGTPIGFIIQNSDSKSSDYDHLKNKYRPGHADLSYEKKYGIRDHRGGGRSSARETACRVVGGAIARQILATYNIEIKAWVNRISTIELAEDAELSLDYISESLVRCPNKKTSDLMIKAIEKAKKNGDSLGGTIYCQITGVPAGIGEPVFDKLNADLGKAMLSINAVKSFEVGSGIKGTYSLGSENNDEIYLKEGEIQFKTNNAGGILGGISSGAPIEVQVGFKPVSTIMKNQKSLDKEGNEVLIKGKGRHDPCVLPRAVPIVESMAALCILDQLMIQKTQEKGI